MAARPWRPAPVAPSRADRGPRHRRGWCRALSPLTARRRGSLADGHARRLPKRRGRLWRDRDPCPRPSPKSCSSAPDPVEPNAELLAQIDRPAGPDRRIAQRAGTGGRRRHRRRRGHRRADRSDRGAASCLGSRTATISGRTDGAGSQLEQLRMDLELAQLEANAACTRPSGPHGR